MTYCFYWLVISITFPKTSLPLGELLQYTHVDINKKALIYNLHADNWYNVLKVKDFTERNIFSIRGSLVWVASKTTCNMKLGSSVTALWLKVVYMLRL